MSKINKIVENSFYFLSSNLVNFTLGFVSSIILARTLQPTNLGIFHQVQWFSGIISFLISFGFITSIIKFTAEYKAKAQKRQSIEMLRFVIRMELFITLLTTATLIIFRIPISDFFFSPNESKFFLISFLAITPGMITAILSATLEGNQIFKYQGLHAITVTPLALSTKIILLIYGFGIEALLWSNLAFAGINLAYYYFAVHHEKISEGSFKIANRSFENKKGFLNYNKTVFFISLVDGIVWDKSEILFLGRFCQASEVAYYTLSHNLLRKISGIIPSLMWKMLLPIASESEGNSDYNSKRKIYTHSIRYSAFILFPIITICLVSAYELIVITFGQEYAAAETCFQILCVGALLSSLTQPGSAMIYAANKQKFILWYGAVLACINIGMNIVFIPRYGATGAAFCYSFVTIIAAVGGFIYVQKILKLQIPWFSLMKISLNCFCMSVVLFICIRQQVTFFDILPEFRESMSRITGFNFELVFGPRVIRLMFSLFTGAAFYILISLAIFKPGDDDFMVITALRKYFPKRIIDNLLQWKQK